MSVARAWRDEAWSPAPATDAGAETAAVSGAQEDPRADEETARARTPTPPPALRKGPLAEGKRRPPVPPRPAASLAKLTSSSSSSSSSLSSASSASLSTTTTSKGRSASNSSLGRATFAAREEINTTIKIVTGSPKVFVDLRVDALVNRTNERLDHWAGLSAEILERAGPMLQEECTHVPTRCQVGEAKITAGCKLTAAYVIHTVAPKYSAQYETAAESALHMCYRNVLSLCKERRLRSVALPILFSHSKGYPREEGAHVAVRTIRRFLDHFVDDFDHVVLYLGEDPDDWVHFRRALALYCPRTRAEEAWSMEHLPENTGNEWGEIVHDERRIRIASSFPSVTTTVDGAYMPAGRPGPPPPPPPRAFTEVVYGVDTLVDNLAYTRLLERAEDEDFKDMVASNIVYRGGEDMMGRPIIVIVAANLASGVHEDRLLMYFAHICDKLSRHPKGFVVVFLDNPEGSDSLPALSWFKHQYDEVIGRKYKKNLRRMYVVHPTWQLKALFWAAMPFVSSKFWDKFYYLDSIAELYRYIPASCILLPSCAFRHDRYLETASAGSWF